MKILIVDDSRAIQTIVRRALEKEGFSAAEFKSALDGASALEIVESWAPDLVITDWHMPGMSGLELLQVLQQTQQRRIRIGFVTTESVQERIAEALANGAAFVLPKPFTDKQLGDVVRQAFAQGVASEPAVDEKKSDVSDIHFRVREPAALEAFFSHILKCPVKISEPPRVDIDSLTKPWMIAFCGLGDRTEARGFCVLDRPAMALIGGKMVDMEAAEIPPSGTLPTDVTDQVSDMLRATSKFFFDSPSNQPVALLRSQLLVQTTPKLKEILDKGTGRRVYRLTTEGFAPATMILIAR